MNKTYLTCVFLVVYFFIGCKTKQAVTDEKISLECQKRLAFIKNEVVENEEGWYEIKDMEKIYQEYDKGEFNFPFNGCFVGKNKVFLREVLGIPHREEINKRKKIHTLVYCFSKKCSDIISASGIGNAGIIFFLDENELVKDYHVKLNLVGHYNTLDREVKKSTKIPSLQLDTILKKKN